MPNLTQAQRNAVSELLRISQVIDDLGSRFDTAGRRLYLAGGLIRDAILSGLGHDLDFAASAYPEETHTILRDFTPTAWDIGHDFGTTGAMKREDGKEWQIEVTIFHAGAYEPGPYKPMVAFGERIEEGPVRRDFTVSAMAVDIVAGELVDPWGGLRDLVGGVLRAPAPTEVFFGDDPLRMIRAVWFASRPGFRVAPKVQDAMRGMAERITIVPAEHMQAELTEPLLTDSPRKGLDLLVRTGVAKHFLPGLPALRLERDKHMRHKGVYTYSLTVPEQAIDLEGVRGRQPDITNRLAALLHDIGKPATRRFEGSKMIFHHRGVVGVKLVAKRLKALKCPTATMRSVARPVELRLRLHGYGGTSWSNSAVHRYVRDAGDELERPHIFTRVDCTTRDCNRTTRLRRNYEELEWRIDELVAQEETRAIRLDPDGAQVMGTLGIIPGPETGKAHKFLLNHRMNNNPLPEDEARGLLLVRWKDRQPQS